MNGIEPIAPVGAVVLFGLKATLLLGTGFLASVSFRKASAALRHLLWTATFAALLVLPLPSGLALVASDLRVGVALLPPEVEPGSSTLGKLGPSGAPAIPVSAGMAIQASTRRSGAEAGGTASSEGRSNPWSTAAVAAWAVGAVLLLGRLLAGIIASIREVLRAREVCDDEWSELLDDACARLSVSEEVSLRTSDRSRLPMTLGLFHPTILLPESAECYATPRRWAVLLHELAHVRRRDCLTLFVAQMVSALYWWNPLVWLATRELRLLSERASDDLVLGAGTSPADYAHDLLEMARGLHEERFTPLASVAMAHRSRFEERLLAILDPGLARGTVSARWAFGVAALALPGLLFVALAVPTRAAPLEASQTQTEKRVEVAVAAERPAETASQSQSQSQSESQPLEETAPERERPGTEPTEPEEPSAAPRPVAKPAAVSKRQDSSSKADPEALKKARAALAEALHDPDPSVQQQALHALVQMKDTSVAPYLAHALESGDPETRAEAAWGLGQMQDEAAGASLQKALSDENAEVREQAAWALGMIRSAASVDGLVGALSDSDESVREQSAWALGMIRNPRAVAALARAVVDANESVRSQAVWALGMLRAPESFDALVTALSDEEADVRSQAAWALGMLRDSRAIDALSHALKDADSDVRQQAAWALGILANGGGTEPDPGPEPEAGSDRDPNLDSGPGRGAMLPRDHDSTGFTPGKVL